MADEPTTTTTETQTPEVTIESLQAEIETLKGQSRKWEDRAKENFEARKELDALKTAQMSDEEKRSADEAKRAKALADAEERAASAERESLRFRIASKHGISDEDADLFLSGADEETLTRQAEALAGRSTPTPSGPRPTPAQGRPASGGSLSPADAFAEAVGELF